MEHTNIPTKDTDEDDWMAAMQLLANGGGNLQFGRGSSLERADSFAAAFSQSNASFLAAESSLQMESVRLFSLEFILLFLLS